MSVSPESLVLSSECQNLLQVEEISRFQEIVNTTKRFIGRCALVLSIASGCTVASTAVEATFEPSPAEAATSFVNNYPDMDAADCSAIYGIYSWCKNGSWLSSRGYGYRNCTDYVA